MDCALADHHSDLRVSVLLHPEDMGVGLPELAGD